MGAIAEGPVVSEVLPLRVQTKRGEERLLSSLNNQARRFRLNSWHWWKILLAVIHHDAEARLAGLSVIIGHS